jgi:sulfonate transport system ATP-binding protein
MTTFNFDVLFREPPPFGVPLTLRNISKSFGLKRVLHGLDLHIEPGQFIAIVGRSGCGKSTMLRLIAGLDDPDGGHISFGDGRQTRPQDVARVMFQEARLLPWAHVLANVEVGLGAERAAPNAQQQALDALAAMGLEDRAGDWPATLSGGQKQRVALARALVSRPRLLAFDEPLGALDALTRIEMQNVLEQAWREMRFTALLVTHDVSEAVALADRILIVENGHIAADFAVALPRPRRRGAPEFAALEVEILTHLLGAPGARYSADH